MAERDTGRFDRSGRQTAQSHGDAGSERLHDLARLPVQKAVERLDCTEATDGLTLTGDELDVKSLVEQRRVTREALERTLGSATTQHHVADDAEGAGVIRLGRVQADIAVTSELFGKLPQPLHDTSGHPGVGAIEELRIDAGRRAYVGAWMTLALEEAKKINYQRRGERSVAFHGQESTVNNESTRRRIMLGGASLIVATLLFAAVFVYLATTFDYPEVLARPAADVLPRLLALGSTGRAVWLVYGLIPVLLIPTAWGVNAAVRPGLPALGRAGVWLATISAVAMMIGLLRWPTLQWGLAEAWPTAAAVMREAMAARFAWANFYLGNVIGEFIGELFLNGFFVVASIALARQQRLPWLRWFGIVAGVMGWTAMLRNITPTVSTIASINNNVLPLWMLMLGVVLIVAALRTRASTSAARVELVASME